MDNDITKLESFQVVGIDGEGVFIVDDSNNCWCVYPHDVCMARDEDELAKAYRQT